MTNLLGLNRAAMAAFCADLGEKPYRAQQLMQWIHQHAVCDFDAMTNISRALRTRLKQCAIIEPPAVRTGYDSQDGTRKWLLAVDAHNCVEMVFIPEGNRATLCISSQVGCPLNCTFCATARQGLNRNLTAAEIVGQLWLARHALDLPVSASGRQITNVVLMGMGEPLLNFENVVQAMDTMVDDYAYGLARRRVTLSTAGVVPKLAALKHRCPVSLAVSLHAADDRLRDQLVPLNRKYPLAALLAACWDYAARDPKGKITFEYVLLDRVNDSAEHAQQVVALLRNRPAKVNLIPFNAFPGSPYRCAQPQTIDRFRDVLLAAGIMTITRKTRGEDIAAACGQLVGKVAPRVRRPERRQAVAETIAPPP